MASAILTQELLKSQLHYNPDTGIFTWAISKPKVRLGMVSGSLHHSGYIHIKLFSKLYTAHRLAWLYCYGEFPKNKIEIDHINGMRDDNRISNLREATRYENQQNQKSKTNRYLGVSYHKTSKKWRAMIRVNNRDIWLGVYANEELAHQAYVLAKSKVHTFNPTLRES